LQQHPLLKSFYVSNQLQELQHKSPIVVEFEQKMGRPLQGLQNVKNEKRALFVKTKKQDLFRTKWKTKEQQQ
jgi:hypothetical protein